MSFTINIYYKGQKGSARKFVKEMENKCIASRIRNEKGNLRYEYFYPISDKEVVLLIDSWESKVALDNHHASPMMKEIIELRYKYNLHMKVEKFYALDDSDMTTGEEYIRK